ncbi:hypothetical protein T12_3792 [Trichinella patagoniensis]|uniref:Uncharacterized protein n=1 Tax=Trichinella patagoniensis TaxID=990121 RepID=A0A0V1A7U3_9BILA|nr:hypothetical protein T12_3792 [Trichinella patagoniensis]
MYFVENLLKRNMEYSELYCRSFTLPRCLKLARVKPTAPWYDPVFKSAKWQFGSEKLLLTDWLAGC